MRRRWLSARLRAGVGFVGFALLAIACSSDPASPTQTGTNGDPDSQGPKPTDWCPAVISYTTASISADFPLPIAVAESGVFQACRNEDCRQIQLSASPDLIGSAGSTPPNVTGADVATVRVLNSTLNSSYVELGWTLQPDPSDYTRTDSYTLSVQHDGTSTELVRASTTYERKMFTGAFTYNLPDPSICGTWGEAVVDLRSDGGAAKGT